MVALNTIQTNFVYTSTGVDETRAKVDRLGASLDKLAASQDRSTSAEDKGSAASDKAAAAKARYEATLARAQRQMDMDARSIAAAQQAQDAMNASVGAYGDAQARATRGQDAAVRAYNDNAAAIGKQTSAYAEAGKAALHHPILAIAGASLASKALAGLATSASTSLGAASGVVQKFANDNAAMGQGAVTAATLAARGLGLASTAAATAGTGLGTAAEKMSGLTTATSLLTRGLALIPPAAGPIAAVAVAVLAGAAAVEKVFADFGRLVQLGERARSLDFAAPFVKSFDALGPKIQATSDQMEAMLKTASNFVRESFGGPSAALKQVSELFTQGAFGPEKPAAMAALETAQTAQDKVRATLDAVKELQDRGQEFAALDLFGKLFGSDAEQRLREGQTTVSKMIADFNELQDKEVLKQEQVDRALALNKEIAEAKQGISDALAVTLDFSAAALAANEAWLKVLQAVQWVVEKINAANAASADFIGTATTTIMEQVKNAGAGVMDLAEKYGILSKAKKEAEVQGPPEAYGPPEPKITGRSFPYTFGPDLPKQQAAAKQAQQAAQETQDAFDSALQRSKDQIQEFNLQASSAGKATEEVYKLTEANRLRRAAAAAGRSDEEGIAATIDAQAAALARARKASEDALEAQRRLQEGQRELASEFSRFAEDVLLGGTKIGDAFNNLAKSLSSNALKAIISGEGPLAGILGTASTERGQVGGLLGGRFSLSSLFGGGDAPLQGPTESGRTLDQESGGFFSRLFDTSRIEKALSEGSEKGFLSGIGSLFSGGGRAGGGLNGSSLMQGAAGLALIGGSYGIGQQQRGATGLIGGAASGALGGFMLGNMLMPGIGGAVGAAAGAGLGFLGSLFGQDDAKKQAKKKLQEQIQAYREALDQARPQIEQMDAAFTGRSLGNVGKSIQDTLAQTVQAIKTASQGGDQALANRLLADYQTFVDRSVAVFRGALGGTMEDIRAGFGTNGPFSQAVASVQQLGEALKGFVTDAQNYAPGAAQAARDAAVEGALSTLDAPKTLSTTQTELERIRGTAAGLNQVLQDLGMSAADAAKVIQERTNKALDALRDKFEDDLGRKINDAQNKSYLNDAADLIKEVAGLRVDAAAVGGDLGQVDTYFAAAAQKIVDSSSLTGAAFQELIAKFPELSGLVHEFGAAVTDTASALDAAKERASGYADRLFAATNDTTTLAGQLAAFDRKAEQDRAAEVKAGGQAIADLERAQGAERVQIISDFAQKAADALNSRLRGYADRYFAATNDTSSLEGQLAAYDRQAQFEREDEIKAGGEAIAQLEQTQAAERLKIIADFGKQAADALQQQLQAAQTAYEAFAKTIKTYLDGLVAGSGSPLAPKDRLAAAQTQFDAQLTLARGGDRTALDSITTYASNLLDASKAYNASNSAFQATFQAVQQQLAALPTQVSAEQFIVNAITDSKTAIVDATQAMQASLRAGIDANSPTLVAMALSANFDRLTATTGGLLNFNQFLAGVGPLATTAEQQAARNIFNAIDANGDGMLSRQEVTNASNAQIAQFTAATNSNVGTNNQITANSNDILNGLNGLTNQNSALLANINSLTNGVLGEQQQLVQLNAAINSQSAYIASTSASSAQLLATTLDFNHAIFDTQSLMLSNLRSANSFSSPPKPTYATGGWVAGPGTGTSDSIAARLSNGEFVVTAAAARLYGPVLEAMNDNAFAMPAVAMPVPVPAAVGRGGDDGETAALLKEQNRLLAEQVALLKQQISTTAAGARHVGEKVDDHKAETRRGNADRRQDANRPRTAGTRAA